MDYNDFTYKNFADKYGVYNVNQMAYAHGSIETFLEIINAFKESIEIENNIENLMDSKLKPLLLSGYQSVISTLQKLSILDGAVNKTLDDGFILDYFSKQGWGQISIQEFTDRQIIFKIENCIEEEFSNSEHPNVFTAGIVLGYYNSIQSDNIMKMNADEITSDNLIVKEIKFDNYIEIIIERS